MNHNLGVRLEQGQFIEIRKVSGTARSEARMLSVSFFKKYFDGIQVGDFVYFTKFGKETYIITKEPYSEWSRPKKILPSAQTTLKIYVDEPDLLFGCYYSFYDCGKHLLMKKSTLKEIEMRVKSKRTQNSGLVRSTQDSLSVQKNDLPFFRGNHGYRVDVYQGAKLYMKITQIPLNQVHSEKTLRALPRKEKEQDMFSYEAFNLVPARQLYIPNTFLQNVKMKRGDHFSLKKMNETTMLVIPKEQKDEITNEFFNPFEERRKIATISQGESKEIKSMQKIKDQTKLDLSGMLKEMRKINNQYI